MANRYFNSQFMYSFNAMPVYLEGHVIIDSAQTGKTKSLKGSGITSIKRVATGTYQVVLMDSYARLLSSSISFESPSSGSTAVTALTPGLVYVIATVGSTTQAQWETAGVPAGVPAAVGVVFVAAATSSGSGTAAVPTKSGISVIEIIADPQTSITNTTTPCFFFQTLAATNSSTTTLIPTDPADGSVMDLTIMLRNSSTKGKGE